MSVINLANKRILYIGPVSFYYDKSFFKKFIEVGAIVDTYNLQPIDLYFKVINKLKLPNKESYRQNYFNSILKKKNYDYVLIRHGYQLETDFLEKLKHANSKAKFINFHWDAIKPHYNYLGIIKFFDKVYSFDYKDCQEHKEIIYLPLFYLDEYANHNNLNNFGNIKFDVLFVGSWRDEERYQLVKRTEKFCQKNNLRFYYYLNYSFKEQFNSIKKGIIPKEARYKSLSYKEILNLYSISNTIIDFPSSFQTGLTMRTFETLGAGKKLITTNKNIIKEPFFDKDYISIIDSDNLILDVDFIKKKPEVSLQTKIQNYSIENYIYKLLS
jgi:hypothetical protein